MKSKIKKSCINFGKSSHIKPLTLILVPVVLSCLFSCSNHFEGGSVTSLLDAADSYISSGDVKNAFESLEQAEKCSTTSYERLGVYKRYLRLGDYPRAEKTIKRSIKKDSESLELTAAYSNLLLFQYRTQEALKVSKKLSGTKYGSLYAEAFLQNTIASGKSANELFGGKATKADKEWKKEIEKNESSIRRNEVFYDTRFSKIYHDAYVGTGKYRWNWNAASLYMKDGLYQNGAELYPNKTENMDDGLFWGLVLFDAGLYSRSLDALEPHENEKFSTKEIMQFRALLADDYYILSRDEDAERVRSQLLAMNTSNPDAQLYIPQAYVNSASYARNEENQKLEYERLEKVVELFPGYLPGLASYGEFALRRQNMPEDDTMTAHIRAAGLSTRAMEAESMIPSPTVEEVLEKIHEAQKNQNTQSNNYNPELSVLEQQLIINSDLSMEKAKKASKVWPLLEKNETGPSLYPKEIMRFALVTLLESGENADAQELFFRYENAAHRENGVDVSKSKKKQSNFVPSEHLEELELWECEMTAWFALCDKDWSKAKDIYDYIIKIYSSRSPLARATGQNEAVINSSMNIANIYSSQKLFANSLEYLNKASSRATSSKKKAEILYRMGKQSFYLGDYYSAEKSLKYSLTLEPNNNKTRFMLQQTQKISERM